MKPIFTVTNDDGVAVITMDLPVTALHLAGASTDGPLDGVNLLPLLTENAALPERDLFWRYKDQKAVRSGSPF